MKLKKEYRLVKAWLDGFTPIDLRNEEILEPTPIDVKNFLCAISAEETRLYRSGPHGASFAERSKAKLDQGSAEDLARFSTAPQMKVSRITTNLGDDIQPSEVSRG